MCPKKDNIISKKKTIIDFEKQNKSPKKNVKKTLIKISKLEEKVCWDTNWYNKNSLNSLKTNEITSGIKK